MIKFGEWLPDQPDLNLNGVTVATNVIPAVSGYRSIPEFVSVSNAADSALLGIFAAKDNSGNVTLFAGDAGKLYRFNTSNSNLVSTNTGFTLSGAEKWRFVQFASKTSIRKYYNKCYC